MQEIEFANPDMQRVVSGQSNKVVAFDLGVSQRTVELHRARVMHKLRMRSLAELVQAMGKIGGSAGGATGAAIVQQISARTVGRKRE
jgi:hypothetical protein